MVAEDPGFLVGAPTSGEGPPTSNTGELLRENICQNKELATVGGGPHLVPPLYGNASHMEYKSVMVLYFNGF